MVVKRCLHMLFSAYQAVENRRLQRNSKPPRQPRIESPWKGFPDCAAHSEPRTLILARPLLRFFDEFFKTRIRRSRLPPSRRSCSPSSPFPAQTASTMHADSELFWHGNASRRSWRNGVSVSMHRSFSRNCGGNGGECCLQREQRSGEDQIAVVKV